MADVRTLDDAAWERELAFRARRNELRDPRDPAHDSMFDCEAECFVCGELERECKCGGES